MYDAKLVKNLSAICKRNLEMLSTNAVTFKPLDFAKKLVQKLTPNDNSDVMSRAKLLSLGQEVYLFLCSFGNIMLPKLLLTVYYCDDTGWSRLILILIVSGIVSERG